MLLYQSRLGPKKPNLTIAWAGPNQIEWVYTNGSVKLKDLAGLLLPGVYNASKIKLYESPPDVGQNRDQGISKQSVQQEEELKLDELFSEDVADVHLLSA